MRGRHTECACYTDASRERLASTPNDPTIAHDTIKAVIALKTLDLHHSLRLTWKASPVLAVGLAKTKAWLNADCRVASRSPLGGAGFFQR
jgi:hypothetical protein